MRWEKVGVRDLQLVEIAEENRRRVETPFGRWWRELKKSGTSGVMNGRFAAPTRNI